MFKKPKKFKEKAFKKQVKKAEGMMRRIAIATEKGDEEELDRVKKDYQAWKERFTSPGALKK